MTLNDLEAFVNAAAAHGGGWLPMTFHDVCDQAASDYSSCMASYGPIDDAVLGQFLDWLRAAGQPGAPAGVTVKTVAQVMPPGTPPPAPVITDQPPTTSNSTTGTFSFTDSQPGVTFQCTVDRVSSSAPVRSRAACSLMARIRSRSRRSIRPVTSAAAPRTPGRQTPRPRHPRPSPAHTRASWSRSCSRTSRIQRFRQPQRAVHQPADRQRRRVHQLLRGGHHRQLPQLPGDDQRQQLGDRVFAEHLPGDRRHRRRADVERVHGVDAGQLRAGHLRHRPRHDQHALHGRPRPGPAVQPEHLVRGQRRSHEREHSTPRTCPTSATSSPTSATTCTRSRPAGRPAPPSSARTPVRTSSTWATTGWRTWYPRCLPSPT